MAAMQYPAPPPLSEAELLERSQQLAGQTLAQLAAQTNTTLPQNLHTDKGWVGQFIEQLLGATASSLPEPDFQQIGVELKTLPINAAGHPQETTYVCTVPLSDNLGMQWESSWVSRKLQRVLWLPIEATANLPLAERHVGMPLLWSPSQYEDAQLKQDWEELMELIVTGQLEQVSARNGNWLQIRPKAANARVLCATHDANGCPAETLPRGFYLRTRFTRRLLQQHYI